MIAKIHKRENDVVLALCDENLLDKKFEEGNLILDLTSDFYKGDIIEEEKVLQIIRRIYIINAVGETCVKFLQENGFIKKGHVKTIQNVPFANVLVLND